jgi:4-amino-4-deoxy-L-arabinose transferase-like glycosyltransferase
MKTIHYVLILAALSFVILFPRLGGLALTDPDETFYAQTAKEMLEDGNWVTPRIFGEPQYEKPVLYYWLIMASYIAFGVNEFSARLPSAVFAFLGVFGVFLIGKLLYSRRAGFLSAVVIATSLEYFVVGRGCVTDTVLTVCIVYTLFFFMAGWAGGKKANYYGAAISAALAVLTKGPIGLFIPGAAILIYLTLTNQIKFLFKKVPVFTSLLVFLAVALPWYIMVALSNGQTFVSEFFGFHNITRFVHPEHKIGDTPVFYVPVVLGGIFPWSVFFLFAVWEMYRKKRTNKVHVLEEETSVKYPSVLLASWFLLVFLFFSVSRTKLVTYILPLFPAMAIITGKFLADLIAGRVSRSKINKIVYLFVGVSLAAAVGAIVLVWHEYPGSEAVKGVFMASGIFLVCVAAASYFLSKGKFMACFMTIAFSVVMLIPPITVYIFPTVEEYESRKDLALTIKELSLPFERVGAECDHRRGIAFYSGRTKIEDIHPSANTRSEFFGNKDQRVWAVVKIRHYEQLREQLGPEGIIEVRRSGKHVLVTNLPL